MTKEQAMLKEKDKIIDLMAEDIYNYQIECNRYFKDKEEVKQYFENKAKELLWCSGRSGPGAWDSVRRPHPAGCTGAGRKQ